MIPTVASIPTAAIPTPYKPTSELAVKIITQSVSTGTTTDSIPNARPEIIIVAGPVSPSAARRLTGAPPV